MLAELVLVAGDEVWVVASHLSIHRVSHHVSHRARGVSLEMVCKVPLTAQGFSFPVTSSGH